jgi:hypothetical protein
MGRSAEVKVVESQICCQSDCKNVMGQHRNLCFHLALILRIVVNL